MTFQYYSLVFSCFFFSGNTRVITQQALQTFQDEMAKVRKDPYKVIMRQTKLPISLLTEKGKVRKIKICAKSMIIPHALLNCMYALFLMKSPQSKYNVKDWKFKYHWNLKKVSFCCLMKLVESSSIKQVNINLNISLFFFLKSSTVGERYA